MLQQTCRLFYFFIIISGYFSDIILIEILCGLQSPGFFELLQLFSQQQAFKKNKSPVKKTD